MADGCGLPPICTMRVSPPASLQITSASGVCTMRRTMLIAQVIISGACPMPARQRSQVSRPSGSSALLPLNCWANSACRAVTAFSASGV